MKNMTSSTSLWLIRLYVVLLGVIAIGGFLEGGAYNLVVVLLVCWTVVQSFFVVRREK